MASRTARPGAGPAAGRHRAGRAAHVRRDHGVTELDGPLLRRNIEVRLRLGLRAAVNVDQDRMRARAPGLVDPGGYLAWLAVDLIEARILHERRRDEARRVERTDLALGPAHEFRIRETEHPDVVGLPRRLEAEREPLALRVDAERSDDAEGQLRRDEIRAQRKIHDAEPACAVLIHDVGEIAAIARQREVA